MLSKCIRLRVLEIDRLTDGKMKVIISTMFFNFFNLNSYSKNIPTYYEFQCSIVV